MDHLLLSGQQSEGGIKAFIKPSSSFIFGNLHTATVNFHLPLWETVHLCHVQIAYGLPLLLVSTGGKGGIVRLSAPNSIYFQEKKTKKTRAQNCGESMLTVFYPSTPDEYRQRWEHLFRVSPHPGGRGLTPAWTICCISCASFGFVTLFHKIFRDQIKWTFKNRVKEEFWLKLADSNVMQTVKV